MPLCATILSALEPLLFGSMNGAYEARSRLEHAWAEHFGQPHAIAAHSGTIAWWWPCGPAALAPTTKSSPWGIPISTTAAVRHCGATPVLCDVLEEDYTLDLSLVEALITPRTRAILPVDLHGHPADVRGLRAIADRYDLRIVEDAALAANWNHGLPVGAFADAAVFSFAPFKPLGSVGNGAMIVAHDEHIARQSRLLVGYGHDPDASDLPVGHQRYIEEGFNVPLDGMEAALLANLSSSISPIGPPAVR